MTKLPPISKLYSLVRSDTTAERVREIKSEYTETVQHPEAIAVLLSNAVRTAISEGLGDERMHPAIDLSVDDRLHGVRVLISQTIDDWKFDASLSDVRAFALTFVAAVEEYAPAGDTLYCYVADCLTAAIKESKTGDALVRFENDQGFPPLFFSGPAWGHGCHGPVKRVVSAPYTSVRQRREYPHMIEPQPRATTGWLNIKTIDGRKIGMARI